MGRQEEVRERKGRVSAREGGVKRGREEGSMG